MVEDYGLSDTGLLKLTAYEYRSFCCQLRNGDGLTINPVIKGPKHTEVPAVSAGVLKLVRYKRGCALVLP